jgi:hypothetical protein
MPAAFLQFFGKKFGKKFGKNLTRYPFFQNHHSNPNLTVENVATI